MWGTLKNWGLFVFGIARETYHERPTTVEISLGPTIDLRALVFGTELPKRFGMQPRFITLCSLVLAAAASASAAEFKVIAHYPIAGEVRFDYLRVDPDMRRLYVSHANRVEVLDVDTGAVVGEVSPMKGVHGIALVPGLKRGFITSGGDRTVVMFDLNTLKVLKVISGLGVKPDAIEYDPETQRIYVANGQSGGITVIDPASGEIAATVPIEGKLEGVAFDGRGHLFVNTEDKSMIQATRGHPFAKAPRLLVHRPRRGGERGWP